MVFSEGVRPRAAQEQGRGALEDGFAHSRLGPESHSVLSAMHVRGVGVWSVPC